MYQHWAKALFYSLPFHLRELSTLARGGDLHFSSYIRSYVWKLGLNSSVSFQWYFSSLHDEGVLNNYRLAVLAMHLAQVLAPCPVFSAFITNCTSYTGAPEPAILRQSTSMLVFLPSKPIHRTHFMPTWNIEYRTESS